jgi:hypothetical protein
LLFKQGAEEARATFADDPADSVIGAQRGEHCGEVDARSFVEPKVGEAREPGARGRCHLRCREDHDGRESGSEDAQVFRNAPGVAGENAEREGGLSAFNSGSA